MSDFELDIDELSKEVAKFGVSCEEAIEGFTLFGQAIRDDPWFNFMFGDRAFYEELIEAGNEQ